MRIRKISPQVPLRGNVSNEYGTSEENAYAQEYQNEHNVIVSATEPTTSERVHFKYSKNLFSINNTYSNKGVVYTFENSVLIMNGTTTGEGGYIASSNLPTCATLKAGTYTLLFTKISGSRSGSSSVVIRNLDASTNILDSTYNEDTPYIFTLTATTNIGVNLYQLGSGRVYTSYKVKIQLKEGNEITTSNINIDNELFTETVSVGENKNDSRVWFKKSRNLFDNSVTSNTSNGASGTMLSTGIRAIVTTAGTNKYVGYKLPNPEKLLGKTLTISATITKSGSNDGLIRFYWGNGDTITTNINSAISSTGSKTFTMPNDFPSGSNQIMIVFSATASNTGAVNDYVDYTNVMLEEGSSVTTYNQYNMSTINVDNEEICNLQTYSNYSIINGLKLCYGEVSSGSVSANSGKDLSVDLPTTYNDTNYKVIASINTGSAYWAELNLTAHANTTSKFEISLWNNGANATDCTISYIVIGK